MVNWFFKLGISVKKILTLCVNIGNTCIVVYANIEDKKHFSKRLNNRLVKMEMLSIFVLPSLDRFAL